MANDDQRPILVCVDGSDASTSAVAAGLALLGGNPRLIVVTVAEETDPMLVTGSAVTRMRFRGCVEFAMAS